MKQTQCPNCRSYKTARLTDLAMFIGLGLIIIGVLLFFLVIPLFFIPIGIIVMIAGLIVRFMKRAKNDFICLHCYKKFNTSNS